MGSTFTPSLALTVLCVYSIFVVLGFFWLVCEKSWKLTNQQYLCSDDFTGPASHTDWFAHRAVTEYSDVLTRLATSDCPGPVLPGFDLMLSWLHVPLPTSCPFISWGFCPSRLWSIWQISWWRHTFMSLTVRFACCSRTVSVFLELSLAHQSAIKTLVDRCSTLLEWLE